MTRLVSCCNSPPSPVSCRPADAGLLDQPPDQLSIDAFRRRLRDLLLRHRRSIHGGPVRHGHQVLSLIRSYTVLLTVPAVIHSLASCDQMSAYGFQCRVGYAPNVQRSETRSTRDAATAAGPVIYSATHDE